jgi:hypothetical protein
MAVLLAIDLGHDDARPRAARPPRDDLAGGRES